MTYAIRPQTPRSNIRKTPSARGLLAIVSRGAKTKFARARTFEAPGFDSGAKKKETAAEPHVSFLRSRFPSAGYAERRREPLRTQHPSARRTNVPGSGTALNVPMPRNAVLVPAVARVTSVPVMLELKPLPSLRPESVVPDV